MKKTFIIMAAVFAVLAGLTLGAWAFVSSGVKSQEGYASVDIPELPGMKKVVSLSVGPHMMRSARWAMQHSDEPAADVLNNINAARIKVYEVHNTDADELSRTLMQGPNVLLKDNWEPTIKVNEHNNHVLILTKGEGDQLKGVVVLVVNQTNVVFINAMGNLNSQDLNKIATRLEDHK